MKFVAVLLFMLVSAALAVPAMACNGYCDFAEMCVYSTTETGMGCFTISVNGGPSECYTTTCGGGGGNDDGGGLIQPCPGGPCGLTKPAAEEDGQIPDFARVASLREALELCAQTPGCVLQSSAGFDAARTGTWGSLKLMYR